MVLHSNFVLRQDLLERRMKSGAWAWIHLQIPWSSENLAVWFYQIIQNGVMFAKKIRCLVRIQSLPPFKRVPWNLINSLKHRSVGVKLPTLHPGGGYGEHARFELRIPKIARNQALFPPTGHQNNMKTNRDTQCSAINSWSGRARSRSIKGSKCISSRKLT